jgi:hypothetical protein
VPKEALGREALGNAISDLNFTAGRFVVAADAGKNRSKEPLLLLLSPDGHVQAWHTRAGAAELGIALRQVFGNPAYSQLGDTN